MGLEDGYRGKAGERRLAALKANPEKFKSMFGGTVEGLTPRAQHDQTPAGYADTRSRDRSNFKADPPKQKVYRFHMGVPGVDGYLDMSETEYASYLRAKADREQAAERRKQDALRAEEKRKNDEILAKQTAMRAQWKAEDDAKALREDAERKNAAVEASLTKHEIASVLESMNCSLDEANAVKQRIAAECGQEGFKLSSLWSHYLTEIRSQGK